MKIKDDINNSLNEFFIKNIIQDTYFNQEMPDDQIYNLLILFLYIKLGYLLIICNFALLI